MWSKSCEIVNDSWCYDSAQADKRENPRRIWRANAKKHEGRIITREHVGRINKKNCNQFIKAFEVLINFEFCIAFQKKTQSFQIYPEFAPA